MRVSREVVSQMKAARLADSACCHHNNPARVSLFFLMLLQKDLRCSVLAFFVVASTVQRHIVVLKCTKASFTLPATWSNSFSMEGWRHERQWPLATGYRCVKRRESCNKSCNFMQMSIKFSKRQPIVWSIFGEKHVSWFKNVQMLCCVQFATPKIFFSICFSLFYLFSTAINAQVLSCFAPKIPSK